ncbi:hypothetical protein OHB39_04935 [Streptomyces sp. NBC_00047]|nr:hypothetical protein [Streptomyces sp. NBC_00047]MCX5606927.1 hypothetical protein [Streptomyces sp. NBC_00047]
MLPCQGVLARGVFVLPKRGARDPADVDRVMALFDRTLRRI